LERPDDDDLLTPDGDGVVLRLPQPEPVEHLGDFAATPRVLYVAAIAVGIGVLGAFVALALLRLIGFFTNLFFFQRLGTSLASPADNSLGVLVIAVPVIGAVIIGFMARYGSDRIRGHGIPEALEAILINGSRMEPKVAVLKPLSSAISIGSGGPFGAEGPIIMTGGAFGSIIAQTLHLTSAERKTLLVAGAAAGMSATFAAPVASVLLAVELLLFEWKPRSLIPVALSSVAAAATRRYLLGSGPIFPVPEHASYIGVAGLAACVLVGLLAGGLAALLSAAVYGAEDAFARLPIHWMWWPAIGGLVIGIGGFIFPEALGVGYGTIGDLLQGETGWRIILGVLIVKSLIWSISLGSGTSGGVLAPLLMVGCALGGIEAKFLPSEGAGFWPMISMAAVLAGTMRAPFTGLVFALELTHDLNALTPLLIGVIVAYGFTVLIMRRSILTEKVTRRGYHITCEYSVDPLELVFVRDVMRPPKSVLSAGMRLSDAGAVAATQRLYPVIDEDEHLAGVIPYGQFRDAMKSNLNGQRVSEIANADPIVAYRGETVRAVAYRMAATGRTTLPVLASAADRKVVGIVKLDDLLTARVQHLRDENERERIFSWPTLGRGNGHANGVAPVDSTTV
jgi:H+/Cl- antiporter ClcA/CBS domain-containing protein